MSVRSSVNQLGVDLMPPNPPHMSHDGSLRTLYGMGATPSATLKSTSRSVNYFQTAWSNVGSSLPSPSPSLPSQLYPSNLTDQQRDSTYPSHWGARFLIMTGAAGVYALCFFDPVVIAALVPTISEEWGQLALVSWVPLAYLIVVTLFQPLWDHLLKVFGGIPVGGISSVFLVVGSVVSATAPSLEVLAIGRGVSGVGISGLMALMSFVANELAPTSVSAMMLSTQGMVFVLANVAGPLLGGVLGQYLTWRWFFYFYILVGILAPLALVTLVPFPATGARVWTSLKRFDSLGFITGLGSLLCFSLGMTLGGSVYAWAEFPILFCFCIGTALTLVFVIIQASLAKEPLFPIRSILRRNILVCVATIFAQNFVYTILLYVTPLFLVIVQQDSLLLAGVKLLPLTAGQVVASLSTGLFTHHTARYRWPIWLGGGLITVGVGLCTLLTRTTNPVVHMAYLLLVGLGCGMRTQPLLMMTQTAVVERDAPKATLCYSLVQNLGAILGLATFTTILNTVRLDQFHTIFTTQFTTDFVALMTAGKEFPFYLYANAYLDSFVKVSYVVMLALIPIAILGALLSFFLKDDSLPGTPNEDLPSR
ncbi:hypothetical protein IWQ62_001156 [Dispira parvispora]|uniref:Major facilitator superfamily (MFS) profile domain-containing protein n=1 Tax=Dispira parvispora TaxID=1520584 RepID=A0A9W8E475_9FUNG|nr:hypothetical protein IWQ62_001156 [Dispira parvispora]